jgi:tetratricopeptide (TPR) repeat protein
MGAFDKAGKLCRLVLKSHPKQADARAATKRRSNAMTRRLRSIPCPGGRPITNKGNLFNAMGRLDEAVSTFEHAIIWASP